MRATEHTSGNLPTFNSAPFTTLRALRSHRAALRPRLASRHALLCAAALALLALALLPSLASARVFHAYQSVITEIPAQGPGGPVLMPGILTYGENASAMTVHSGDLYVAEALYGQGIAGSRSRTDQFAPSLAEPGHYEFASQLPLQPEPTRPRYSGIDFGSAGVEPQLYIGQPGGSGSGPAGVDVFSSGSCGTLECASSQMLWTGAEAPEETRPFAHIANVAVDHSTGSGTSAGDWASGDVLVADQGELDVHFGPGGLEETVIQPAAIDVFELQAGGAEHYVAQLTGPALGENFRIGSIAVSGFNGDLVVSAKTKVAPGVFRPGVYLYRPEEESPGKGTYVLLRQLTPPDGEFKIGNEGREPQAFAVDNSNGEIYVATRTQVYQFSASGASLGDVAAVPKEGTPSGHPGEAEEVPIKSYGEIAGLAVDPASGRLFVRLTGLGQNQVAVIDVLGPDVVVPDVATESPTNLRLETDPQTSATSWALRPTGTLNPLGEGQATCSFAWGTSPALGHSAPCSATIPNGTSPVRVHAALTGLAPDTTYYYRLQAENHNGTNSGEESQTYHLTTPGPGLHSTSVSAVSSQGADLEATIDPHDGPTEANDLQAPATSPTTYYFQYSTHDTGACAAEPATCSLQPLSPLSIGSGAADVEASQHIRGLAPSTTYHYRVVAANEALPESAPGVLTPFYGSDLTFITQPPGAPLTLPDHRAWELVSPADKHGARVEPGGQAALDGASFTFLTHEPTEPATAGNPPTGVQVLATRAAPGRWSDRDIALSHSAPTGGLVGEAPEYRFFTEDLGLAVAESLGPFSIPEGWHQNAQGEWQHALEASPVPTQRTPYLRHNLTCAAEPSTCYEPLLNEADVTSGLSYEGDPTASHGLANFAGATPDGTHLVIGSPVQLTTAAAPDGGLYDWSADGLPSERLALASVLPDGSAASGVGDSRPADGLLALSADGSRLVFAVDEHPANGQTTSQALYLRDLKSEETVRLDLGEGGLPVSNSLSLYQGASADALTIFFTNVKPLLSGSGSSSNSGLTVTGDLYACEIETGPLACRLVDLTPVPAAGQPGAHESAQVRRVLGVNSDGNYVYFIARGVLAPGATPGENIYLAHREAGHWTVNFIASAGIAHQGGEPGIYAHVSPNGQWLAFTTRTPLTGYDNRDLQTGQPDLEAYLYDAATETLTCASCDPTGARPTGPAEVPASPRSLFDTGRLFFESADALVPQDTNGELDVYESEPAGLGDCTSSSSTFNPATGACVGLISSGVAFGPSRFIDASASGADVFFTTQQRLIPEDVDTATDVYDAHECTAASPCAAPAPPEPPPCQTADACRPAAQPQPTISGEPPSAAFHGAGNVKEEPASKKHHKKKHHKAKKHRRRASHNRGGQK